MSEPLDRAPVCRFGPDRRLTAVWAALGVVGALAAAFSSDPEGRLLAAVAALALAAYAVTDLVFWPRLTASADGLRIRAPAMRATLAWSEVAAVRLDERARLGLSSRTLEIDAGDRLVVFSRRALGADPRDVLGLVTAFDPR